MTPVTEKRVPQQEQPTEPKESPLAAALSNSWHQDERRHAWIPLKVDYG